MLQQTLLYVASALEANLDVFRVCKDSYPGLGSHRNTEATHVSILLYMRQTIFHLDSIHKMIRQSRQIADLVSNGIPMHVLCKPQKAIIRTRELTMRCEKFQMSNIIDFRNCQTSQRTNETIQKTLEIVEQQNFSLATTARQSERHSKGFQALNIAATIYLPASLVATIFSSNLIQTQPRGAPTIATQLHIVPQFWAFIVSSLGLMVATFCGTWWLRRRLLSATP